MKNNVIHKAILGCFLMAIFICAGSAAAQQYVQPERNDTIYLTPKTAFNAEVAKAALAKGKSTIKGVAFIRPENSSLGFNIKTGKKLFADRIKISLYPITPYFDEFLALKKKEKPRKLKYAFLSKEAISYRLEAITNSTGEFTFPEMKPGKYYIEGVLNWTQSGTYQQYTGSGYNSYGGRTNYYTNQNYVNQNSELLTKIVEVKKDGEIIEIKLK